MVQYHEQQNHKSREISRRCEKYDNDLDYSKSSSSSEEEEDERRRRQRRRIPAIRNERLSLYNNELKTVN